MNKEENNRMLSSCTSVHCQLSGCATYNASVISHFDARVSVVLILALLLEACVISHCELITGLEKT